jgi:hypothetical protein
MEFELEKELYTSIGRFIFWFSKLEGYLKSHIVGILDLDTKVFDAVVSPYDFVTMCTVLEKLILSKGTASPEVVAKYFGRCKGLNTERVRVAHGDWTLTGTRHVARNKLRPEIYFATPAELDALTDRCKRLMADFTY